MEIVLDIAALNEGRESAFHMLYTLYYKALVNYAMQFTGNMADAEDLVQDNMLALATRPVVFDSEQAVATWLYAAVHNRCLNYLKHKRVEETYRESQNPPCTEEMENEGLLMEEVYRRLFATIDELPPRSREVLLKVVEGKRNAEIAAALGISIETVKTHRKNGLAYLRERLGGQALIWMAIVTLSHHVTKCG